MLFFLQKTHVNKTMYRDHKLITLTPLSTYLTLGMLRVAMLVKASLKMPKTRGECCKGRPENVVKAALKMLKTKEDVVPG